MQDHTEDVLLTEHANLAHHPGQRADDGCPACVMVNAVRAELATGPTLAQAHLESGLPTSRLEVG